jgi:prepilin-type N-terminal cleavage/methylation domain-containing protein
MALAEKSIRSWRRAFTFVELLIGLAITAIVMGAMAAMMTAVGTGWTDQEVGQSTQLSANQVYARVQKVLAAAKYVIIPNTSATSNYIIFWRIDGYPDGATADTVVQAGEIAMIIRDSTTNSLMLYQTPLPCSQSYAGTSFTWTQLQTLTPATIEGWPFVQHQVLGGPGTSTSNSGFQVTGSTFYVNPAWMSNSGSVSQLPVVEFSLTFTKGGENLTLYNSSTLRSPTTQPN